MNALRNAVVIGLIGLAVGACDSDGRAGYVAPHAARSDVALLKRAHGTHVDEVDNTAVGNADYYHEYGWNTVPVTPGVHELIIMVHRRNGQSYIEDPWKLNFHCEKGHIYEFRQNDDYGKRLKVVDMTTHQTMIIDG